MCVCVPVYLPMGVRPFVFSAFVLLLLLVDVVNSMPLRSAGRARAALSYLSSLVAVLLLQNQKQKIS